MGLEMELNSEKACTVGESPKTVLPSHRHRSSTKKRTSHSKPVRRDDLLSLSEDFLEIDFSRYRSTSCNSVPSRNLGLEAKVELKRASVYQSSKEMRRMTNIGNIEQRRKIEISRGSDTSSCVSIMDSLCSSDEGSPRKRSSVASVRSKLEVIPKSSRNPAAQTHPGDRLLEICQNMDNRRNQCREASERDLNKDVKFSCDEIVSRVDDGNVLREREKSRVMPKSLSVKLEIPDSPSTSESGRPSGKVRFSPIRKMFDPLMKSKSLRNPSVYSIEKENIRRDVAPTKPLPQESAAEVVKTIDSCDSEVLSSPVHLHGSLKVGVRHGLPIFEFSLNCTEDVFMAKTGKTGDGFNSLYTFHSFNNRKRSSSGGWGLDGIEKESTLVGKMQASCYIHSELRVRGDFDHSLVMEFVLNDSVHARRVSMQANQEVANSNRSPRDKLDNGNDDVKPQHQSKHINGNGDLDSSNSHPWEPGEVRSDLEVAAIVIQVPYGKREGLKCKRDVKARDNAHVSLLKKISMSKQSQIKEELRESIRKENMNVIIPMGNHGLPESDSQGPSSLLRRWRAGGGCECGGWDMGCPLTVLGRSNMPCAKDQKPVESIKGRPLELFVQGAKETTPALTMKFIEEGYYAVDFHARLSSLQAFSICVAMLHGAETSGQESKELAQCNSLKELMEEEVNYLIETVTGDKKLVKKVEDIPSSYVLNPPFSPIARV